MKLSTLFLASALGLASAAPLRILVVPNQGMRNEIDRVNAEFEASGGHILEGLRFGHAAAYANVPSHRTPEFSALPYPAVRRVGHKGCGGHGGLSRVERLTDKWRKIFGFPPIVREGAYHSMTVTTVRGSHEHHGMVGKVSFVGGPMHVDFAQAKPVPVNHHRVWAEDRRVSSQAFAFRLSRALSLLGPWEGRAISFVLGCGLGVLCRMFFVLILVLVRMKRARAVANARSAGPIALPEDQAVLAEAPEYPEEKAPVYTETVQVVEKQVEAKEDENTPAPNANA
ncbi:hypothetical protein FRB99_006383 [Tulasnella sp. 403]|nr:hypothetical protein FRB99_006383 [Tulasnella sp. 403]